MEATVAFTLTFVLMVWMVWFDGTPHINALLQGSRVHIYRTVATIAASLLGFSIAAISFALHSTSSPRFVLIRKNRQFPLLWKTFFQAIHYMGMLVLIALACILWDQDSAPNRWFLILFVLFTALLIVRLWRVIWILEQIITLLSIPTPSRDTDT